MHGSGGLRAHQVHGFLEGDLEEGGLQRGPGHHDGVDRRQLLLHVPELVAVHLLVLEAFALHEHLHAAVSLALEADAEELRLKGQEPAAQLVGAREGEAQDVVRGAVAALRGRQEERHVVCRVPR